MARLVLGGLELQDNDAGIWFDVVEGDPDEPALYVGEDDEVVGATGREPGEWLPDVRQVVLFGHVEGVGATPTIRRAAYRAKVNALVAKMDASQLFTLVAHGGGRFPNFGLVTGQTATLSDLRFFGVKPGPARGWEGNRAFEIRYECIKSPPNWVIAGP